jgi:Fe-S cluster assembly ATPase SufC
MKHFKETEGGREIMCEAVEEYANEKARIAAEAAAKEATEKAEKKLKKAAEKAEKAAEKAAKRAEKKKAESLAIKMLKAGKYALDEIASLTDLSLSQVQKLQKKI